MNNPGYTKEELSEFDRLTARLSSRDQMTRLNARLRDVPRFVAKHGQAKCNAMFAELQRRDNGRA